MTRHTHYIQYPLQKKSPTGRFDCRNLNPDNPAELSKALDLVIAGKNAEQKRQSILKNASKHPEQSAGELEKLSLMTRDWEGNWTKVKDWAGKSADYAIRIVAYLQEKNEAQLSLQIAHHICSFGDLKRLMSELVDNQKSLPLLKELFPLFLKLDLVDFNPVTLRLERLLESAVDGLVGKKRYADLCEIAICLTKHSLREADTLAASIANRLRDEGQAELADKIKTAPSRKPEQVLAGRLFSYIQESCYLTFNKRDIRKHAEEIVQKLAPENYMSACKYLLSREGELESTVQKGALRYAFECFALMSTFFKASTTQMWDDKHPGEPLSASFI